MDSFPTSTLSFGSWREIRSVRQSVPLESRYIKSRAAKPRNIHKLTNFTRQSIGHSPPDGANIVSIERAPGRRLRCYLNQFDINVSVIQETNFIAKRDQATLNSAFYKGNSTEKLDLEDMEVFGDLSSYCHTAKKTMEFKNVPNSIDELNTPVFEKAPFDYDRSIHSSGLLDIATSAEDPFNLKLKSELSLVDSINIDDNNIITENTVACKRDENKANSTMMPVDILNNADAGEPTNNYLVISSLGISSNSSNLFMPSDSDYGDIYHNNSDKVTPIYKELKVEDEDYFPTVNNCRDIFLNNDRIDQNNDNSITNESSTQEYLVLQTTPFETPDNSRSVSDCSESKSSNLMLNLDQKFRSTDCIDTPDVIDAIETEKGFNILSFITDEDIYSLESSTLPLLDPSPSTATSSYSSDSPVVHTKQKRKHRKYDDDDEDYMPPTSKKRKLSCRKTTVTPQKLIVDDTDPSDDEQDIKISRRGRPPKRQLFVTSEESCGNGKYREMRDKNNEASRKSRLKRKLKEVAQEEEFKELEDRNTKLKAQVEQLEKTVNNFRNNLMQILLKK